MITCVHHICCFHFKPQILFIQYHKCCFSILTKKKVRILAFYDIYEQLCKEKGVTPTQAGRENGIKQQTVSMWKKRGTNPSAEVLVKLADYFHTTPAYLMGNKLAKIPHGEQNDGQVKQIQEDIETVKQIYRKAGYSFSYSDDGSRFIVTEPSGNIIEMDQDQEDAWLKAEVIKYRHFVLAPKVTSEQPITQEEEQTILNYIFGLTKSDLTIEDLDEIKLFIEMKAALRREKRKSEKDE